MTDRLEEITGRELIRRQLKRLRESLGMSMQQFADSLNYSKGRIADLESGRTLPTAQFAALLDERYSPMITFTELLANVRDALVAEHMRDLLPEEQKAVRIQAFTSSVMPGLVQTENYAWELSRKSMPGASDQEISARAALRMDRQLVLVRREPPYYRAVIDEAAFARPVGGSGVMAEQLRHIASMVTNRRNSIQVLPFGAGCHGMMGGSLSLWTLADGRVVALVESYGSGEPIENPARVSFYSEIFDQAKEAALSQGDSLDLIRQYQKEYEND